MRAVETVSAKAGQGFSSTKRARNSPRFAIRVGRDDKIGLPTTLSYYSQVGPSLRNLLRGDPSRVTLRDRQFASVGGFFLTIHETALQKIRKINGGRYHIPQGARDPRFACSSGSFSRPS
jgi:hypothetical protein